MTPRVSVLVPTYNRELYVGRAVESILAQTYRDFEIVVVDDGSSDETAALLCALPGVRYVRQRHAGISAARNRALEESRGEWIAWLDSDDLYDPVKLEKQVAYLDAHPDCDIVFCRLSPFSDMEEGAMAPKQREMLRRGGVNGEISLASACMRKTLFDRYGVFNTRLPAGEDSEWLCRAGAGGTDLDHRLREALYLRRIHEGQTSVLHGVESETEKYQIYADAIRAAWRRKKQC